MPDAFICDAVRTPIGRYGGALSSVRTDDLGAIPMAALVERNPRLDPDVVDDISYGCANQAGEDNRNVARMSALLAGLPVSVPAATVNRLCGSGMNAVGNIADAIRAGGLQVGIAGGVESMSRAPFVLGKQSTAFGRNTEMYDTTLGWRFVNRKLEEQYGIDSMAETAENVADDFDVSREDQDAFALRSQLSAEAAIAAGVFRDEIIPVSVPQRKGDPLVIDTDEHPRPGSTIDGLARLRPIVRADGSISRTRAHTEFRRLTELFAALLIRLLHMLGIAVVVAIALRLQYQSCNGLWMVPCCLVLSFLFLCLCLLVGDTIKTVEEYRTLAVERRRSYDCHDTRVLIRLE